MYHYELDRLINKYEMEAKEEGIKEGLKRGKDIGRIQGKAEGKNKGVTEGTIRSVKSAMKYFGISEAEALKALSVPRQEKINIHIILNRPKQEESISELLHRMKNEILIFDAVSLIRKIGVSKETIAASFINSPFESDILLKGICNPKFNTINEVKDYIKASIDRHDITEEFIKKEKISKYECKASVGIAMDGYKTGLKEGFLSSLAFSHYFFVKLVKRELELTEDEIITLLEVSETEKREIKSLIEKLNSTN